MKPTYYVKHPDGSFSEADPQPAADDKAGGEPVAKIRITEFGSANNRKKAAHVDTLIPIDQFNSLPDGALLYTHPQPQAEVRVPDGYVLVPVEPTDDMLHCAQDRVYSLFRVDNCSIWDAMLSAAPKQQ